MFGSGWPVARQDRLTLDPSRATTPSVVPLSTILGGTVHSTAIWWMRSNTNHNQKMWLYFLYVIVCSPLSLFPRVKKEKTREKLSLQTPPCGVCFAGKMSREINAIYPAHDWISLLYISIWSCVIWRGGERKEKRAAASVWALNQSWLDCWARGHDVPRTSR